MADITGMLQAAAGVSGEEADEDFANTVLLLHGDGTDGSQNNTFLDSSTNNFTITRNGNTTQGTFSPFSKPDGRWGNYFDGSGDYLSNTSTALITNAVTTFTVETWVYLTANPPADANGISAMCSLDGQPTGPTNYMSFGPMDNRVLKLFWFDGAVKNATGSTAIALNEWTHIACVVNSNSVQFYVNGVSESMSGTTTLTNRSGTQGNFSIGSSSSGVITGYLSNFRVTTTAVYTTGFTPSTSPLTNITNTKILTCQSNRFVDNSTNAYALTAAGNVAVNPFSPFPITTAYLPSVNGGAGYFDGSGDYLEASYNSAFDLSTGDFTVQGWFYNQVTSGYRTIVSLYGAGGTQWIISLDAGNYDVYVYPSGTNLLIHNGAAPSANQWVHFALVRDGANFKFFSQGALVATVASQTLRSVTQELGIGTYSNGSGIWTGYVAGLQIIKGTAIDFASTGIPTAPPTAVSGTSLLCNFTNAGILDNTCFNALESVGNCAVNTTTKKYGTGSLSFDGTGDKLVISNTQTVRDCFAFGTGDFTVEMWLYPTADPSVYGAIPNVWSASDGWGIHYMPSTAGNPSTIRWDTFVKTYYAANNAVPLNQWTHIAISRASGSFKFWVNGVQSGSTQTDTENYNMSSATFYLGDSSGGSREFTGYIDDLRITKGVARYTTTFTPPDKALPNIGV